MARNPHGTLGIIGRTDEETARLEALFRALFGLFYEHCLAYVNRRLKAEPPTRTDWSLVEIANLALSIPPKVPFIDGLRVRLGILWELSKSLIPITSMERRAHAERTADDISGALIGTWLEILHGFGMMQGDGIDGSTLDDAMLPTGLDDGIIEQMLSLGDIPFDEVKAIFTEVRLNLQAGKVIPDEAVEFLDIMGVKFTTPSLKFPGN